jgi:hypothetical protein
MRETGCSESQFGIVPEKIADVVDCITLISRRSVTDRRGRASAGARHKSRVTDLG